MAASTELRKREIRHAAGKASRRSKASLRENSQAIEAGVPHPTTYVLDRQGIVRFADARSDFHIWLDPELVLEALAAIP